MLLRYFVSKRPISGMSKKSAVKKNAKNFEKIYQKFSLTDNVETESIFLYNLYFYNIY